MAETPNPYFQLAIVLSTLSVGLLATAGLFYSGSSKYLEVEEKIIGLCIEPEKRVLALNLTESIEILEKDCYNKLVGTYYPPISKYNKLFKILFIMGILVGINTILVWTMGRLYSKSKFHSSISREFLILGVLLLLNTFGILIFYLNKDYFIEMTKLFLN